MSVLDIVAIVASVIAFAALIGLTIGCEKL